jgi:lipopolysaccharide/colanic/teichoic acid biosynthesis glycosyltransferase
MRDGTDRDGKRLPDEQRITSLGQRMRAPSLDELPELWNVVKGDMSLVGPRPLLVQYLDRYSAHQARRHLVRPGLTGFAQVNGRNASSWSERLDQDVWYVDHRSMRLDISILFRTVVAVVRREGISADDHVTMPEFTGE